MAGCSSHILSRHLPSSSWVLDARYRYFHANNSNKNNFFIPHTTQTHRNWLKHQQMGSLHFACICSCQSLTASPRQYARRVVSLCPSLLSPIQSLPSQRILSSSPLLCSSTKHSFSHSFANEMLLLQKYYRYRRRRWVVTHSQVELASGMDVINNLGLDTLTFLAATVFVIPTFKAMKASPILGFLLSGVVLNQLGLIHSVTDIKALSELGILFLLFEMGLELSLARLKALAKFAFGMGLAQVFLSTLAFTAFELPPNGAVGTRILEWLFHARPDLVNIRTVDEAVVIGAALSLSSSAFVLQLLAEKGELPTRFGSATLGILLLQDIAVVPLLVILPILESGNLAEKNLWPILAAESLRALAGLGAISLGGRLLLRRIFEIVANSRSSEAFVALCLLTVTGTSFLTQKLGFSDTLGAFLAGALLAETNYRTQVESDIRPFRGLLLGLFFVTTGTSIDLQLLLREWPNVIALLAGLIAIKTAIITAIGPRVGLSLSESVRTGLLLSQGGEFAFVVFSLANRLGVLPLELNRLLIIVVVLSMALTPFLNEFGRNAAEYIEVHFEDASSKDELHDLKNYEANAPVVIIGFGSMGQVLANFLSTPLAAGLGGDSAGWPYVAFDLDPGRVKAARKLGFPVLYGDGSRPEVLATAGISMPKAVMVMYTGRQKSVQAVERIRLAFPHVPIYARAQDLDHLLELKQAGTTDSLLENAETSLQLGSVLLRGLGVMSNDVSFLRQMMRESMELRAQETLDKKVAKDSDWLVAFQAKVRRTWKPRSLKDDLTASKDARLSEQPLWAGNTTLSNGESSSSENRAREVMDRELPLLFSRSKFPGQEVDISVSSGAMNGTSGVAQDDVMLSSSTTIAIAGPTGTIMEQDPQQAGQMDKSSSEPQPEALTVTICTPSDTAPEGSISSGRIDSVKGQPASLAISKLKWRRRKGERLAAQDGEDERGVTLCALTDDDERYKYKLEGDDMERIDETIASLERDESN